ncbi:DUF2092 domain-containing protein [Aphanothece hegewaldii]|nr:DUF2092 domain-containing protein [Aphanothece hegewaldii]
MKSIRAFLLLLTCFVTSFMAVTTTLAQNSPTPISPPSAGLKTTTELLNQFCNFLKAQQSFTFEIDVTYDNVLESGAKVQYSGYQKVWVQKPDRLRSDYIGDERQTRFYYDGKTFSLFTPPLNVYATRNAPSSLDQAVRYVDENYGLTIPMSNLVISDPCSAIESEFQKPLFIGNDLVNRVEGYHLLLIGQERDAQVWISKDEPPLLLKAIITYKNLPGSPQYTALFSNWNFKPLIPENTFIFVPPKDASKIEFLPPD